MILDNGTTLQDEMALMTPTKCDGVDWTTDFLQSFSIQSTAGARKELNKKFKQSVSQQQFTTSSKAIIDGIVTQMGVIMTSAHQTTAAGKCSCIILSGRFEGFFGWASAAINIVKGGIVLDADYIKKTCPGANPDDKKKCAKRLTYLEFGGWSVQIVFAKILTPEMKTAGTKNNMMKLAVTPIVGEPVDKNGAPLTEEIGLYSKSLLGRAHEASSKYVVAEVNGQFLRNGLKCYSAKADLKTLYKALTGQESTVGLVGSYDGDYSKCLGPLELIIKSGKDVTTQKQMFKPQFEDIVSNYKTRLYLNDVLIVNSGAIVNGYKYNVAAFNGGTVP